jgi:hypothetical protein
MYWVLNKKTDEPFVCGSIPVLAKLTGYEKRPLSVHFSEKKETSLNDENFRIERVDLLRSERGKKNK